MRNEHAKISRPHDFKTHPGDKFHIEYSSKLNPDGTIQLTESGRRDIQAEINSHLEETDMAVIINKLQYGDTSVLSSKRPMYGDFTNFPKTYAEAFDMVSRSSEAFERLPVDIKSKFDNDVSKWFSQIGSDSWLELMGLSSTVIPDSNESEVSE